VGEKKRSGDAELSMEGRLIEKLIIIILKGGCGGDKKNGEVDITRLY